ARALAEEPGAVRDPEAVLLVDDDERQPPEPDGRLDEGMRADDHVDRPALEAREDRLARLAADPPGQERDADAGPSQPGGEARHVLLGEDLGRRHERALKAVARGEEQREPGDDRLPAADVSLEESRHRAAGAHV